MITAVSLFAGIGGFDLALERQGVNVTASVEIDYACQQVLTRHFPKANIFTDVREITADDIGPCDILTAGWPCQGNSVAGRRGGMADPRSGLWSSVSRLLGELRPRYFIGENVPGLLTVNGRRDFLAVIRSLDELGYGVAWRVLDAQNFGVPQRRRRVLIVGCLGDGAGPAEILLEPESGVGDSAPGPQAGTRVAGTLAASAGGGGLGGVGQSANAITSRIVEVVSTLQGGGKRGYRIDAEGAAGGHLVPSVVGTLDAHDGPHGHGGANVQSAFAGHYIPAYDPPFPADGYNGGAGEPDGPMYPLSTQAVHNRSLVGRRMGVRRLTPRECERLQGFPDDWTAGQSDSARYRQLGNAVAVPVIEWVTRRLLQYDQLATTER